MKFRFPQGAPIRTFFEAPRERLHGDSYGWWLRYRLKDKVDPRTYYYLGKHYYERCRYGFSRQDEWSLDCAIGRNLLNALLKYKNDGLHGEWIMFHDPTVERTEAEYIDIEGVGKAKSDEALALWDMKIDAIYGAFYDNYGEGEDGTDRLSTPNNYIIVEERLNEAWKLFGEMVRGLWW